MIHDNHMRIFPVWGRVVLTLLSSPWFERLVELAKVARRLIRGMAEEGIYEVLDYRSTLELRDTKGARARVTKYEKVRYLQNSILAYQDQAWGDGEILINYQCSPGVPVDRYRPGKKTYILISLREVKNRGDVDEFNMAWGMGRSFLRRSEQWEAHVGHRMKRLRLQVIFPAA